jgi:exopolyphosphatase / guanosine-5'-triphosphate,3'-diphosphate pyrophosphatase
MQRYHMDRCAGVDIGTNTILLIIGEQRDGLWTIVSDHHAIARLGEGVHTTGIISPTALDRATAILSHYAGLLKGASVKHVRAAATSAVRDAANGSDVLAMLSAALGHPIQVISGAEEARLTFTGTVGHGPFPAGVCDIGGGSTELVIGNQGQVRTSISLQMGAVRLEERWRSGELPRGTATTPKLDEFVGVATWYAVAGTPTSLALIDQGATTYDAAIVGGHILSANRVETLAEMLLAMSQDEIAALGIPTARADILPAGAVILREIMRGLQCEQIIVSTRGLRYGLMMTV